jgi:tripartite-type tricarboxylate transporter receptor subunit TctC
MSFSRRSLLGAMAASALAPCLAQAQSSQSVMRLIVPFTQGTGMDMVARTIGPGLGDRMGRPAIVENRAGASGNIGAELVAQAAPDGNTILVSANTLVMARTLYPKLSFDPLSDFTPIALASWGQLLLVTHPKTGFKTAGDLLAAARARPGSLNYASPGAGTPHHMSMEMLKSVNKVFITHIAYRGTAPAVQDMVGGHVDAMFMPIHVALPLIKAGRLVVLGLGGAKRHPLLPDVPTLIEAGAGDVNVAMWYGFFGPKGMAPDLVEKLHREINQLLASPETARVFSTQGMDPAPVSLREYQQLVRTDAERWANLIQAQRITAD